jgi:methionyl aminopeptidase
VREPVPALAGILEQDYMADANPGRNAACWCGSGKKYKKCHLEPDLEIRESILAPKQIRSREIGSSRH